FSVPHGGRVAGFVSVARFASLGHDARRGLEAKAAGACDRGIDPAIVRRIREGGPSRSEPGRELARVQGFEAFPGERPAHRPLGAEKDDLGPRASTIAALLGRKDGEQAIAHGSILGQRDRLEMKLDRRWLRVCARRRLDLDAGETATRVLAIRHLLARTETLEPFAPHGLAFRVAEL